MKRELNNILGIIIKERLLMGIIYILFLIQFLILWHWALTSATSHLMEYSINQRMLEYHTRENGIDVFVYPLENENRNEVNDYDVL